jgi:hypothetical protein
MSMDHSCRVFATQPLEIERDPLGVDRSGLEVAARGARAAWDDSSRLHRSSCRTGDPAAACTAWVRGDRALADVEHVLSGAGRVETAAVRARLAGRAGGDWL